jgi:hypothetical protein
VPLLAVGLVAALALHGTPATCRADARAAVAASLPTMKLLGPPQRIRPADVDLVLCGDFDGDGARDVAVTIASGGTAGDVGYAAFVRRGPRWQVVLRGNGYKLGLFRLGRDLVVSQPVYRKNDPNCCPTGGFDHARYRFRGGRFVVLRRYHSGSYRP